jgi:hypothetical protein
LLRGDRADVQRLFDTVAPKLRAAGHTPIRIVADPPSYPAMDLFVAFHCDGSLDARARGCTFGFRDDLSNATASKGFGNLWRAAHNAVGYPGGNRPTNSTTNLSRYYALEPATRAGAGRAIVVEFGFLTTVRTTTGSSTTSIGSPRLWSGPSRFTEVPRHSPWEMR